MVYVTFNKGNFCIDKYENSLSDQCQFINPTDTSQSQTNIGDKACQSLSVGGGTPWINITQEQAMLACTKAGKRLPTNAEWQAAALGTPDKSTDWNQDDCQVDKNWSAQPGATGSGKNCLSFVGAYDMIGNVWEWVDGTIDNNTFAGRQLPPEGYIQSMNMNDDLPAETASTSNSTLYNDYFWVKDSKTRGLIRGGYWANKADAGQYSAYAVFLPSDYGTTIGFRCVK
jgi:formylglycine-generating enzyme required for sulfatase activity